MAEGLVASRAHFSGRVRFRKIIRARFHHDALPRVRRSSLSFTSFLYELFS